jgi:hypothetical protein
MKRHHWLFAVLLIYTKGFCSNNNYIVFNDLFGCDIFG